MFRFIHLSCVRAYLRARARARSYNFIFRKHKNVFMMALQNFNLFWGAGGAVAGLR